MPSRGFSVLKRSIACVCAIFVFSLGAISRASAESGTLWIDSEPSSPQVEIKLPSFAPVIEKLGAAVVNIAVEGKEGPALPQQRFGFPGLPKQDPGQQPNPFDFFFQLPPELQGRRSFQSLGSGFVIHPDGYIVTNNHVVERATKISVTFRDDKKSYTAKVIGSDRKTDLALLKVDAGHQLSNVVFGDSGTVQPGDWVIAIGTPFRLGHTATVGIVSAKGRRVPGPGGSPYDDFIQTDASINPGNSGGPLFNSRGEVIGVNTAIFSPGRMGSTGFNIGIGFAIPVNIVRDIISELHKHGRVTRGWLGVLIQQIDEDTASALKLSAASGALVAKVMEGSPAAKAGIQRGDVIVSYDGHKVEENDDLPMMVAKSPLGKEVAVNVIRRGKAMSFEAKIEELKESEEDEGAPESEENKLGLSVQDITPEIARSLGLDESKGVVVTNVAPDREADRKGLRRGDVILEVDSQAVNSSADFRRLTKDIQKNKPLLLLVNRANDTVYFTLKLDEE